MVLILAPSFALLFDQHIMDFSLLFPTVDVPVAVGAGFGFTVLYVGSIYLWHLVYINRPQTEQKRVRDRDDPGTIKRRFFSVTVASVISYYIITRLANPLASTEDIHAALGVRLEGLLPALIIPFLLVVLLFLGPLVQIYLDPYDRFFYHDSNLLYITRNVIVCPFTEEWVFRGCVIPLLLAAGLSHKNAIIVCPLFFASAHVHHIFAGKSVVMVLFQFLYTSVFGWLSSYIFVRTGHVMAPIIAHAFCNYMGFPNLTEIPRHPWMKTVAACYIVGLVGFFLFAKSATTPSLYDNDIFYLDDVNEMNK